jgi:hypothetical protein
MANLQVGAIESVVTARLPLPSRAKQFQDFAGICQPR